MAKYYRLARQLRGDSTALFQRSHRMTRLRTGKPFRTDFEEPFVCFLDNVLDCVHCTVMSASDHQHLGPGMDVIDEVVLDPARIPDRELFLLGEDPAGIVIGERVHDHLASRGYPDLFFDPIRVLEPEA